MNAAPTTALDIIQQADRAAAVLHPLRREILARLAEPNSASGLARDLQVPRQKINYHLRELEAGGFLRLVEERRKGNCTERLVQATARWYVISPTVLGALADDTAQPAPGPDRFSSSYLVAVASRLIRDVAVLRGRADAAGKALPTLTLHADVTFASAADRSAFADELAEAYARLAAKYHAPDAPGGRPYRFVLASHPVITKTGDESPCPTSAPSRPESRSTPRSKPSGRP